MRFHITIMRPEGQGAFFVRAFHEIVETVSYGLSALGHDCSFRSNFVVIGAQNIVFASQYADPATPIPDGSILYNFEQLEGCNPGLRIKPELARRCVIWDYSPANLGYWRKHDIDATVVPLGYVAQMTRILPMPVPDVDVGFYGALNPRRAKVIDQLQRMPDLKFQACTAFGKERDDFIRRCRVLLNVHFYENGKLYEQARVNYLLANRKAVTSELSDDFPPALEGAMLVVPYTELADACRELVKNVDKRLDYQRKGYELFSKLREVDILRGALRHLSTASTAFAQVIKE